MKKIGIFCLGARRENFVVAHANELSKCKYDDFHFYLMSNNLNSDDEEKINALLKDKVSILRFDPRNSLNYMMKIVSACNIAVEKDHQFCVKHDEDCFMTSESWDKFFYGLESMQDDELVYSGVISSGVPTVDLFLEHHAPAIKEKLGEMFKNTKLGLHVVDYDSLNDEYPNGWNTDIFYEKLRNFHHYYKGIHPVRVNFDALKAINDYILDNYKEVMSAKEKPIIRDAEYYPYFCNSLNGIRTKDLINIVSDRSLFVDAFDEVPMNRYRQINNKKFVFDCGIPIIHTMYNWSPNFEYEKDLINTLIQKSLS